MEKQNYQFEKQVLSFDYDSTILIKNKEHNGTGESLDDLIADSLRDHFKKDNLPANILEEEISKIQSICKQGMAGEINFAESLNMRLAILNEYGININKDVISKYAESAKGQIDPKMIKLLKNLQEAGHTVVVVSGGFEDWIVPMLDGVVPAKNIRCNKITNTSSPLSVENVIRKTKEELIKALREDGVIDKNARITAIGDGMTDFNLFEDGVAQEFIGAFYSENRPKVQEKAIKSGQECFYSIDDFVEHMKSKYCGLIQIPAKFLT